ncbi:uncharacterized protein ACB058_011242 [Synchiropus picturatus]
MLSQSKANAPAEMSDIQRKLLQVLQTVSSSNNFSLLTEVMESMQNALGGDAADVHEVTRHILESIKEESPEGEDEGLPEVDIGQCAEAQPLPCQDSSNSHRERNDTTCSVQDYLECIGRLQDHADVLDDVKKDIINLTPVGNTLEELQIQKEECRAVELQMSQLAGVLTSDLEKARRLLSSLHDNIPQQIQCDLTNVYQEIKPNVSAVYQLIAEMNHMLHEATEVKKAQLESTYQSHLAELNELTGAIQKNSVVLSVDLNSCDVAALKNLLDEIKVL